MPEDTSHDQKLRELLIGSTLDGKYRVLSLLGVGAMGSVYKAEQLSLGRFVAIKILKDQFDGEEHVRRFHNEATALKRLSHPNIVSVQAFAVTESGRPYMVLEYIEGKSLSEIIEASGAIPLPQCWPIFNQILDALSHAHQNNLIHRDLKPSNVMICQESGQTVVKLVDFGLAKLLDDQGQKLTRTGAIAGTPAYLSPEQCAGIAPGPQSDLYSLGCTLFTAVHGSPPFDAENFYDIFFKHINDQPPDLTLPCGEPAPPALRAVVRKALAKDKADRFACADQFAVALSAAQQSPDVVPASASINVPRKPTKAPDKRVRAVAVGLAVILLAAGASFAAVWWQERARDNARARAQALFQGARVDFTDFTPSRPRDAYNKTMEALRILDDNKIPVHELEPELKGLMRAGREGLKDYKEKGDNIKDGTQMFVEVLKRYETFAEPDETFELNSYVGALLLQDSISRTTRMTDELVQAEQNSYRAIEFGDQKTRLRRNLYLQAGMTLSAIADVEYDEALASDTEAKVRSRMGHAEKLAFDAIACFERCKLDIVTDRIFSSAMFRLAMAQQAQGKFAEAETHVSAALGYRNYSDLAQPLILCQRKIDLAEMYVKEEKWDKAELLLASVFEQWEKHPDLVRNPISMIENYIRAEDGLGHKKRSDELHVITRRLKSKLQREILAE